MKKMIVLAGFLHVQQLLGAVSRLDCPDLRIFQRYRDTPTVSIPNHLLAEHGV